MNQKLLILKKNLESETQKAPHKKLYFFDESRFGTHSKIGHGWFAKGERTAVKIKLGFDNFYVYSAVDMNNGHDFSLIMPNVNTNCMNIYLLEMSEYLQGEEAIMVMDGAGWHKSKELSVPHNIKIIYLPPYSPELNPVEKLWQYLKSNTIKNKVYECIEDLKEAICQFIINFDPKIIMGVCSSNHYKD